MGQRSELLLVQSERHVLKLMKPPVQVWLYCLLSLQIEP